MNIRTYLADTLHGATQYPCAWLRPDVYYGKFADTKEGALQKLFFNELLKQGFKRTPWQLVFPGQTAGIIKKIPPQENHANEQHLRFYTDGGITAELEFDRFHIKHWRGERNHNTTILEELLKKTTIEIRLKEQLRTLFRTDHHTVRI